MKVLAKPADTANVANVENVEANVDRLATIWAIVEARQTFPALIAVASATQSDDTESIARGLARAAQESGKRTGYLYLGRGSRAPREHAPDYTDFSFDGHRSQRQSFDASFPSWRTTYEVIIVDLPQVTSCALGAHVARVADGIIVAVYPDRKVTPADRDLRALFSHLHCSIIGIVKTAVSPIATPRDQSRSFRSLFFPVRRP